MIGMRRSAVAAGRVGSLEDNRQTERWGIWAIKHTRKESRIGNENAGYGIG